MMICYDHIGFSDVNNACCGDGTLGGLLQCGKEGYKLCAKPNEYLFWDYFHPSEHTYKLISKGVVDWKPYSNSTCESPNTSQHDSHSELK